MIAVVMLNLNYVGISYTRLSLHSPVADVWSEIYSRSALLCQSDGKRSVLYSAIITISTIIDCMPLTDSTSSR
jgi:hypothetical protein